MGAVMANRVTERRRARAAHTPVDDSRGGSSRIVRVIGIFGRVLVVAGVILLFYTTYLLWGTSVYTKQQQTDLARQVEAAPIVSAQDVAAGDIPAARPAGDPKAGDPLFSIVVPKIGLRQVIVSGVGRDELKKGPGHFPETPYPGEPGNVAISGHRTTYGAPFYRLNDLAPGDIIDIESGPARYRYRVREQKIVAPTAVDVVKDHGVDELTLTTCHPRFSAAQRLVIHADYEGPSPIAPPAAAAPEPEAQQPAAEGEPTLVPASGPPVPNDALALAALAVAALLGAMALSDRLRRAAAWSTVVIVGASGLWVAVFPQILRLMPANY